MRDLSSPTAPNTVEMHAEHKSGEPNHPQCLSLYARFETVEQAQAAAALFPKSCRVRVSTLSGCGADRSITLHTIGVDIWLNADGVNKGVNETGIKRYRSIMRAIGKAGLDIVWLGEMYGNSIATQDEFEQIIAA